MVITNMGEANMMDETAKQAVMYLDKYAKHCANFEEFCKVFSTSVNGNVQVPGVVAKTSERKLIVSAFGTDFSVEMRYPIIEPRLLCRVDVGWCKSPNNSYALLGSMYADDLGNLRVEKKGQAEMFSLTDKDMVWWVLGTIGRVFPGVIERPPAASLTQANNGGQTTNSL